MNGYTVVGGGAIGGTLAFHLARAGHPVTVVDADPEHVAAIQERGLVLRRGGADAAVPVRATAPHQLGGRLQRVLLAVKAHATDSVAAWLAPHLAADGFVVSLQNGLNEETIARHTGSGPVVGAFVNLFADMVEPGVISDGGAGALMIGEVDGSPSTRVDQIATDLQAWGAARATTNVSGFLWSKLGFGAMLVATALADAPMADLIDRHRSVMHALAAEIYAVADEEKVTLEPFDAFDPLPYAPGGDVAAADAATDRLTAWLRTQAKNRSGIWRDLAVRRRPTEVPAQYEPVRARAKAYQVPTPRLDALLATLARLESGADSMDERHLERLAGVG